MQISLHLHSGRSDMFVYFGGRGRGRHVDIECNVIDRI